MTDPLLADRVAVVTGAGQGIGREIARSLRSYGAEVAGAVVVLASDLASYITGTVIEVGGGRYI